MPATACLSAGHVAKGGEDFKGRRGLTLAGLDLRSLLVLQIVLILRLEHILQNIELDLVSVLRKLDLSQVSVRHRIVVVRAEIEQTEAGFLDAFAVELDPDLHVHAFVVVVDDAEEHLRARRQRATTVRKRA